MPVLLIMDIEGVTVERYDEVDEIPGGTSPDNAPEGLISHTAGETETGFSVAGHPAVAHLVAIGGDGLVVVDVWGSEEEFEAFAEAEIAPRAGGWMGEIAPHVARLRNHVPVKTPVAP